MCGLLAVCTRSDDVVVRTDLASYDYMRFCD